MVVDIRTFCTSEGLVRERRDHIRRCATALFVKKPYSECNMPEILSACGMSNGALYYYVASKEDIRSLIVAHAAEAYVEVHGTIRSAMAGLGSADALREAIHSLCKWMDAYQDEMIVINHEIGSLSREDREPLLHSERQNVALFEGVLQAGVEAGEFDAHDAKARAHTIYLAVRAWAYSRWYLREFYSLDTYVDSLAQTLTPVATGNKTGEALRKSAARPGQRGQCRGL
jgi:AcrR family transcriptional regulator